MGQTTAMMVGRIISCRACLGAQVHAAGIVGIGLAVHQTGDLTELTAHLQHHALGGTAHGVHGEGGEHEGQAGADEQTHQHHGVHEAEILEGDVSAYLLDLLDVGGHQGQSGQSGGADGEALAGGGGGVAQRVQSVGALADLVGARPAISAMPPALSATGP